MTTSQGGVELPDFDALYDADPDPWNVETAWYERRKLDIVMASLPRERYASTWEPGCGPGFVSQRLAGRTERLFATDPSRVAIAAAAERCRHLEHVRFEVASLLETPREPGFELVVIAEFLYYVERLGSALEAIWDQVAANGQVAFVHWAHHPDDAFRSGTDMHQTVISDAGRRGARHLVLHEDADFRLDVFEAA